MKTNKQNWTRKERMFDAFIHFLYIFPAAALGFFILGALGGDNTENSILRLLMLLYVKSFRSDLP